MHLGLFAAIPGLLLALLECLVGLFFATAFITAAVLHRENLDLLPTTQFLPVGIAIGVWSILVALSAWWVVTRSAGYAILASLQLIALVGLGSYGHLGFPYNVVAMVVCLNVAGLTVGAWFLDRLHATTAAITGE